MALIRIQECSEQAGTFYAKVSFNQEPAYDVTIHDPFSSEQEERLEWYFEEHLKFPFTDQVKAQEAAASICKYGEKLFEQVFAADPQILSAYKTTVQMGLNTLQIEIVGQPSFHTLHWEALKDPELLQPLALQATIVHKNLVPQAIPTIVRPSPTINLLIVTARPKGKRDVGYRTISGPLVETLHHLDVPVQVDILRPGTYKALEDHLREITNRRDVGYYHVIHFDVHGSLLTYEEFRIMSRSTRTQRSHRQVIQPYNGLRAFLALEGGRDGTADLVGAEELAVLLMQHQIPIAILNACQSGKQVGVRETSLGSHLAQEGVQLVLAMGYSVTVSAAEQFMRALYQQFFAGSDLSIAIRGARTGLYYHKERRAFFDQVIDLEDWLLPIVYQNQPVQFHPREFTAEERNAYNKRKLAEKQYVPPEPQYGFVGRDIDILQIEKRVLAKRNLLLIRGMGGVGKTTLLKHLRAWWHTTGFVQQTFYFGYDERAWTLQQILTEIAQQLYGSKYYIDIQPYPLEEQQIMITERLHAEQHLLILDNLESITGAHLAIQHTLPKFEQDALRGFLADLATGKTLVLLGSRGGEDWLAKGTFDDNIYDLPGLDDEAASTLANRILERNHATKYREDEKENQNLRMLIKVLDGSPLAMEVVLANLKQQPPGELLEALQAGDVRLDTPASQQQGKSIFEQKTESILRCIDYSHSNLSPEAQQLLLCLAPFTSVLSQIHLEYYTAALRQQPLLAKLPFERWSEVVQEATNWGLLSPDPRIPGFLRLQPTLPYFLRSRLQAPEQAEVRSAIETAFRQYYELLGAMLTLLFDSKDAKKRRMGQLLTDLEYENLVRALTLALVAQASIITYYRPLSEYLESTQQLHRGLELGRTILSRLEAYPPDKLTGQVGAEFGAIIDGIAKSRLLLKQYQEAEQAYQQALDLVSRTQGIDEEKRGRLKASTYHQLGVVAEEQRQFAQAQQYYQQALQIAVAFNDGDAQADTYYQLGVMAWKQRQFAQAQQYYQRALQIEIDLNDHHKQARTYHQLGTLAWEQRQFTQAQQYYQRALQIYIDFNDRHSQASTYHNLGALAWEQGQFTQAQQYYQQALQIYIDFNDHHKQADTYHNLGIVAQEQGQFTQAQQYYQQALQIYIDFNDHHKQADTYHSLGVMAARQRQWAQAREYFLRALEVFVLAQDTYKGNLVLHSLARLWQLSGDASLPATIASIVGITPAEAEELLRRKLENEPGQSRS